jgi:hypothetical protein
VKWTSWVTFVGLALVIGVVVYSSFRTGAIRCDVCVQFQGREACRSVDGDTEADARTGAMTNACALVASGVTDGMACNRSVPTRAECRVR